MKRYASLSEIIETNIGATLSGLPFLDFLYSGGIVYHTVQSNENNRIDLIAYAYLGDNRLWPIIAWYNGIRDPLTEVVSGAVLAIPVDPVSLVNNCFAYTYQ